MKNLTELHDHKTGIILLNGQFQTIGLFRCGAWNEYRELCSTEVKRFGDALQYNTDISLSVISGVKDII